MRINLKHSIFVILTLILFPTYALPQPQKISQEQKLLTSMHSISSNVLFDYVKELCSTKYEGRLTGTSGYNASAEWVISHFKKWGIKPAGDNGTYLQAFPNPYTLVFKGSEAYLHIPFKEKAELKKYYQYEKEYLPGSTSDSGEVTAEVIYVGYGITAPELNFDEYKGLDVKEKIVLVEREVPISPEKEPEEFMKWRPYSFHQYKVKNAKDHGVAGMLYNYGPLVNPNCTYLKNFILTYVGNTVMEDIFTGTGRKADETKKKIDEMRKPQSFKTGKIFTIKNLTENHPEGIGYNVIGYVEGTDPVLKNEAIIIGAHLDHVGMCHVLMPGANDNASGIAVTLGVAEAIAKCPIKPKRSIIFLIFGAEEQGVAGSEFYLNHPFFPNEKILCFINMDGVGCGDKLRALAAKNFPDLWNYFEKSNNKYIHRIIEPTYFQNIARPRLDAAHFMGKNIPILSFSAFGAISYYHNSMDTPETITPEIMEDLAQLIFMAVMDVTNK
ncbi:MAG: M28 family peptidase [Acidobacteriota bacterium]